MKPQDWRIEPVLLLLFIGMVLYTFVLIYITHLFFTNDKVFTMLFTTISNLIAGFGGAFFMRVNPRSMNQQDADVKPQPKPPTEIISSTTTMATETTVPLKESV